jgi:hypothetical protein
VSGQVGRRIAALKPAWTAVSTVATLYLLFGLGITLLVPKKPCSDEWRLLRTAIDLENETANWFVSRDHPQLKAREQAHESAHRVFWLCMGRPAADLERDMETVRNFKAAFDRAFEPLERAVAPIHDLQEKIEQLGERRPSLPTPASSGGVKVK